MTIERSECISCGSCQEECPQVFELSPNDDLAQVVSNHKEGNDPGEGTVPDDLEECIRSAADACPVEIISVEE
ncbi:MAG: ferredoxin [Thermoplasmata archaeon]